MPEHSIVHVEFAAKDPNSEAAFYASLLGWQLQPIPSMNYIRFRSDDGTTGGFVGEGEPPGRRAGEVLVYLSSQDIDADLKRVAELGGTVVVPKTEIPNTGWFAIFQDPAGNRLGLFTRTGYVTG